jgi:hypothetical protein
MPNICVFVFVIVQERIFQIWTKNQAKKTKTSTRFGKVSKAEAGEAKDQS